MTLFQNQYRIESTRLNGWDYSNPWWYYVTINSKDHTEYFGNIESEKMVQNRMGQIAEEEWLKTKLIRSNVELDYFVIMPNHLHGIIIITNNSKDVARNVSTNNKFSEITPKFGSLSTIIRSYKSATSKRIHEIGYLKFSWQPRFYERIIRDEKELNNIRRYIEQNPLKWNLEEKKHDNICELS
ncbi:MAG: hypothetical protein NTX65_14640 [Ignavibacteriales bacterium]|nr:hypothetical protein [Ignavibacteriales bacterium]